MERIEKLQDIDYLYASARIRSLEKNLMTRDRLARMAEARSDDDALKVLSECGYKEMTSAAEVHDAIEEKRRELYTLALQMAPEEKIVRFFQLRYDYHNAKAIIKGEAAGTEFELTLTDTGRIPVKRLYNALHENALLELPAALRQASAEAKEVLARTGDPRLADTILDRACFSEMLTLAKEAESAFLESYARLQIDSINLRTAIRLKRMNGDSMTIDKYFLEGGNIPLVRLRTDITPEVINALFESTPLKGTALAAGTALRGETGLAPVDTAAENALLDYLRGAKYIAFGEQPLVAFLAANEAEFIAVHTVMAGRQAGLAPETILERLRETYV